VVLLLHMATAVYCMSLVHAHNYFFRKDQDSVKFTLFVNVYEEDQPGIVEKSITCVQTVLLLSAYDNKKKIQHR